MIRVRGRVLIGGVLTALMLCSCLPAGPAISGKPTATMPPTTAGPSPTATSTAHPAIQVTPAALQGVTLQVWQAFSGPAGQLFSQGVAEFNSTNSWGLNVVSSGYGDYTSLAEAVSGTFGSTQVPDLVVALPEQTSGWSTAGRVVDLTPFLSDPTWGLGSAALQDIPAVFWSEPAGTPHFGIPAERSEHFLFYNETWAHELGFTSPPQTAAEFQQQACAANASFLLDSDPSNDGYGGWVVDSSWQTIYSWLLAFGGGVVTDGGYRFDTPQNLAALEFLKGLYDDHCAWISTADTPLNAFAGRLALFISGDLAEVPLVSQAMSAANNHDDWTVLPFPGEQREAVASYGPDYTVLTTTPVHELAAWVFIRWLLSPQEQARWVETTGLLPLRSSSIPLLQSYPTSSEQWLAAVNEQSSAQTVPSLASWDSLRYVLADGTNTIFQTNTPQGQISFVLDEMDTMAQELGR